MTDDAFIISPFQDFIGHHMKDWGPDFCELTLDVRPEFLNRSGVVHGGVLATLLDTAGGVAGCYQEPGKPARHTRTISMTTNFIAAATGPTLIAIGKVIGGGQKIFFSEMTCRQSDGQVIATASANYKRIIDA